MKAFPFVLCFLAVGVFFYTLPDFLNFLGIPSEPPLREIIYFSLDNGQTFERAYFQSPAPSSVYDFENDYFNSSLIYAGASKGLFISKNGGKNWYPFSDLEGKLKKSEVRQIAISSFEPKRIFLSINSKKESGLYETVDKFFSLKKIFDSEEAIINKIIPVSRFLILGLSDGRLLKFSLNDSTFELLSDFASSIEDVAFNRGRIFIATKDRGFFKGDLAGNFSKIRNESIRDLGIDERGGIYAASLAKVLKSEDGGNNFRALKTVNKRKIEILDLFLTGKFYLAAGNNLCKSLDRGQSWKCILETSRKITALNLEKNGRILIGTGK